jgi:hypothetical protein
MIKMKITLDPELERMVDGLPTTIVNKCVRPAAKAMGNIIIAHAKGISPSSRRDGSREKWSRSAKARWEKYDSGQRLISNFWTTSRGGILFVGMEYPQGNKMHFRLPMVKKTRRQFFWGVPAQNYEGHKAEVPLEDDNFLVRAERETRSAAASVFKTVFIQKFKELDLGKES